MTDIPPNIAPTKEPAPPTRLPEAAPPAFTVDGTWVVVSHRVIYGDTDGMGVVYYGNYMRFFEIARNELVRARGGLYRELEAEGFFLPVTDVEARYRQPARYDDVLHLAVRTEELGVARVRFAYRITRATDGALLVTGATTHACVARETGRPVRLPEAVRRWATPPT